MNAADDIFWAWLAGFIDGEGSLKIYPRGATITIGQKDRRPLDYIQEVLDLHYKLTWNNVVWYLQIQRQQHMYDILKGVMPYLKVKDLDAEILFEHLTNRLVARKLLDPQERGR